METRSKRIREHEFSEKKQKTNYDALAISH